MIPHRMLNNDLSGSGLRDRVTACRKRLRENRVMFKAQASTAVEEFFPELRIECSPFEGGEVEETGASLRIEGQEVGIT